MINNTPTAKDFYVSGKSLLDFAWDTVSDLLVNLEIAEEWGQDIKEISDSYWDAAKRRLSAALSIAYQGVELLLKGKIAEVSPYLLIADGPQKWPSPYNNESVDFSQFKTLEAQDLIKAIDTVAPQRLDSKFANLFNDLRKKRNTIMHSVDKNITVHVFEIIDLILFMHKTLLPEESWAAERLQFLEESPDSELGGYEYSTNRVYQELSIVFNYLSPPQVKLYFGINKNQRLYYCPKCLENASREIDFNYQFSVLVPKGPSAKNIYCPVCNKQYKVFRQNCGDGCRGNVISESGVCLTCGNEQVI